MSPGTRRELSSCPSAGPSACTAAPGGSQCKMCDVCNEENIKKQAETELGQAQLKLELDFTLNLYRFGFSGSVLADLCRWI